MSSYSAYPRVFRSELIHKLNFFRDSKIEELGQFCNDIDLNKYHYSPVIGKKVSELKIQNIRKEIIEIVTELNFPNKPTQQNIQDFDIRITKYLFENLDISPNEASKNEIWSFFTCELIPDIVKWRFFFNSDTTSNDALIDRYIGGRRNTVQRLWWRAYTFKNLIKEEDPYSFLKYLNSDDMREIEERTTLFGNLNLVRAIAYSFIEVKKKNILKSTLPRDILRDVIRRLLRQVPWLSFESLNLSETRLQVVEVYNQTLKNFNENTFSQSTEKNISEHQIINKDPEQNSDKTILSKDKLVNLISQKLQTNFKITNQNFVTLKSEDKKHAVAIYISKRYERTNQKYWYTINNNHEQFLAEAKSSYIILGMEEKDFCFVIPYKWFDERKDFFSRNLTINGSRTHLYIEDDAGESYIVRSKDSDIPLESIESFIFPENFQSIQSNYEPIHESQLIDPSIQLIKKYGNKGISTSELIKELRSILKPSGEDTKKLKGRSDDKFSQKVRNLKSHRKLDNISNISFLNDRYYWLNNISTNKNNLSIPNSIDWRSEHFIKILKEKLPLSGGVKAENQWNVLKMFNNRSILDFQDEASKRSMLAQYKNDYSNHKNDMPWWDQELHYCLKRKIIKIVDEKDNDISLN